MATEQNSVEGHKHPQEFAREKSFRLVIALLVILLFDDQSGANQPGNAVTPRAKMPRVTASSTQVGR
jgi:hypothetical protein